MAFSGLSYFAGIGTAFVAVAIGFAGGALVTTSAVQPPNRLERVTSSAPPPPAAPSKVPTEQPNAAAAEGTAPSGAPPSQKADSHPAQQPLQAEPVVAKSDTAAKADTATNNDAPSTDAQRTATPAPSAKKSDDAALPKNERTGARASDSRREARRKRADDRRIDDRKVDDPPADDRTMTDDRRADDRRFTGRKRRQDLDAATNTVRQMRRDNPPDQVVVEQDRPPRYVEREGPGRFVERGGPPRYVEERAPRPGFFGLDDDAPRARGEGSGPFGFFGNN